MYSVSIGFTKDLATPPPWNIKVDVDSSSCEQVLKSCSVDDMQCKKVFLLEGSDLTPLGENELHMVKDGVVLVGLVADKCLAKPVMHMWRDGGSRSQQEDLYQPQVAPFAANITNSSEQFVELVDGPQTAAFQVSESQHGTVCSSSTLRMAATRAGAVHVQPEPSDSV